MVNRPKQIGTAAETAVVHAIRDHGFPHAERRSLNGSYDLGDVTGTPGIVWEVKGGAAAKDASDGQVALWLVETERERVNAHADWGVLVVQRRGIGAPRAHQWWAVIWSDLLGVSLVHVAPFPVRITLEQACRVLVAQGYGSAIPMEASS